MKLSLYGSHSNYKILNKILGHIENFAEVSISIEILGHIENFAG